MRLKDKVAIVTGGNMGLGRDIAECFAEEGATVVITARTQALIDQSVAEIRAKGGKAFGIRADLSKPEEIHAMVNQVAADHGNCYAFELILRHRILREKLFLVGAYAVYLRTKLFVQKPPSRKSRSIFSPTVRYTR